MKQAIRSAANRLVSLLDPLSVQSAFVELQLCDRCSFTQTKIPFHEEDILHLYRDYRTQAYHQERTRFEPSYASIADSVGYHEREIQVRTSALAKFLGAVLSPEATPTILDYGGSDGRFIPDRRGAKFVYDVSDLQPVPGVTRISNEPDLGQYSLVLLAHVTEHAVHPLNLVRRLKKYISPDSYLYIETPQEISDSDLGELRAGRCIWDIGIHEHINYYCESAVKALLESAGFEVIKIEKAPVDLGWASSVHLRALGRMRDAAH